MYGTPEYAAWAAMNYRCHNPNAKQFYRYGARGISVCREWRQSFEAFFDHIGPRPSSTHSLDRLDNDAHYQPGNVRWATPQQQTNNRNCSVMVTYRGKTMALGDWAVHLGLPYALLCDRIVRDGWSARDALTRPVQQKGALYAVGDVARTMKEWAGLSGIKYATLRKRVIDAGLSMQDAVAKG